MIWIEGLVGFQHGKSKTEQLPHDGSNDELGGLALVSEPLDKIEVI